MSRLIILLQVIVPMGAPCLDVQVPVHSWSEILSAVSIDPCLCPAHPHTLMQGYTERGRPAATPGFLLNHLCLEMESHSVNLLADPSCYSFVLFVFNSWARWQPVCLYHLWQDYTSDVPMPSSGLPTPTTSTTCPRRCQYLWRSSIASAGGRIPWRSVWEFQSHILSPQRSSPLSPPC